MLQITTQRTTTPKAKPDESNLGFGVHYTDHMLIIDHEPRRRFARTGRHLFSAPAERGARTALACSLNPGGTFLCTDPAGHSNCRRRVRP